jgi:hypothetical protein
LRFKKAKRTAEAVLFLLEENGVSIDEPDAERVLVVFSL